MAMKTTDRGPNEPSGPSFTTGIGAAFVGFFTDLSRAMWPVSPAVISVLLVGVFGLSFFAMTVTGGLFIVWAILGTLFWEREAAKSALRTLNIVGRFIVAATAIGILVPAGLASLTLEPTGFFLPFFFFNVVIGVAAALSLTVYWKRSPAWRERSPILVLWVWFWGGLIAWTELQTPVGMLQVFAHAFGVLLALTLVARLLWFSISPARLALAIAAFLVLAQLCVFLFAPDAGLRNQIAAGHARWVQGLVAFGLIVFVGEALSGHGPWSESSFLKFWRPFAEDIAWAQTRPMFGTAGFALGFLAVGALAVCSVLSAVAPRLIWSDPAPVATESPQTVWLIDEGRSDEALASRFSPVLLAEEEARYPSRIEPFLASSSFEYQDGQVIRATADIDDLNNVCARGLPELCYRLRPRCTTTSAPCDLGDIPSPDINTPVYARVLHRYPPNKVEQQTDEQRWVFRHGADELTTLVQYWYFYVFNEWVGDTVWGEIRQTHEGDWEAVTVGLAIDDSYHVKTLFVAASAHCGGSWKDAFVDVTTGPVPEEFATVFDGSDPTATHPVIYVASGSQAHYFDDRVTIPDWPGCLRVGNPVLAAASSAYHVRENIGSDRVMRSTARTDVTLVNSSSGIVSFPGLWGASSKDAFTTITGRSFPRAGEGAPDSPGHHALWIDPLATVFCSNQWRLTRYPGETVYQAPPIPWECR